MAFEGKKIFIFGGCGSLGTRLVEKNIEKNKVINFSRDEMKHWAFENKFNNHPNLKNIQGDIRDKNRVRQSLLQEKPEIIIIAAAMKRIENCQCSNLESLLTNTMGPFNVMEVVDEERDRFVNLECVCQISSDKSCSANSAYGSQKHLAEQMAVEKSLTCPNFKFVIVRYGNVLNSRGSIIPFLHGIGTDSKRDHFPLTDERMTRFIMTIDESCELIRYAIQEAESGSVVIPKLKAMKIKDIFEIFSEIYGKPIKVSHIRFVEKLAEDLINTTESLHTVDNGKYYHIMAPFKNKLYSDERYAYNSNMRVVTKDELKAYLESLGLLDIENMKQYM